MSIQVTRRLVCDNPMCGKSVVYKSKVRVARRAVARWNTGRPESSWRYAGVGRDFCSQRCEDAYRAAIAAAEAEA